MAPSVITVVPERLHALCNAFPLDGRTSTHPGDARGQSCMNCYVLVEHGHALLIDTGVSIHQDAIVEQLEGLLDEAGTLSILPVRFGEFNALCNARPIADRFPLRAVYGRSLGNPAEWLDFRPGFDPPGGGLTGVEALQVSSNGTVGVDPDGARRVEILVPPLRLIIGFWAYDPGTRTLFTADQFTWLWQRDAEGPWIVGLDDDTSTVDSVRDYLVHSRYWWLAGARTERLRRDLADVFDRYEIDCIAPGFGCVLQGRDMVARHFGLLDEALAGLEHEPSIGLNVGQWPSRSAR